MDLLNERRKQILENNKKYIELKELKKLEKKKGYYQQSKWRYQRYYQNHKEYLKEYQREYYDMNKEEILEKQRIKHNNIIYDNK
jgi:hypothetical protein